MSFLNKQGSGANMTGSLDIVANSLSLITPDGSLQRFTGTATGIELPQDMTGISKANVGLGNVDNTSDLNKPISTATQAALNLKANITSLNKEGVGLGNVDNTTDLNKPISTATQTALDLKANNTSLNKSGVGLGNVGNTSD
jgi:hypothetical protein